MEVRELNVGEIEHIKQLMIAVFSRDPWNDAWTDQQLHAYLSELMGNQNSLSYGIYDEGALIGMALGRIKSWYEGTEYWIEEFGILPEMQQRGIGTVFMKEIEKLLKGKGIFCAVLLTDRNTPAHRFYEKNGFEEKKETAFFVKTIC